VVRDDRDVKRVRVFIFAQELALALALASKSAYPVPRRGLTAGTSDGCMMRGCSTPAFPERFFCVHSATIPPSTTITMITMPAVMPGEIVLLSAAVAAAAAAVTSAVAVAVLAEDAVVARRVEVEVVDDEFVAGASVTSTQMSGHDCRTAVPMTSLLQKISV